MPMPLQADPNTQYELFDDFFNLDTVRWASVDDAATGTNTANDVAGGQVSIVTAGADNDYHLMTSTKKIFQFLAGKPVFFEAEFSLTEAAANAANLVFGLTSVTTAGFLADNGGGPPSTFDGAVIYKVDGAMALKFATSKGTAQTINASLCAFVSGITYRVGFAFDPCDGVTGLVTPYVADVTNGVTYTAPGHKIVLSGLGAMGLVYGVKAGGANAETLKVNSIRCVAAR